jgi:very-short-patch-repair endonuclease
MADAALRTRSVDKSELRDEASRSRGYPNHQAAQDAVAQADGRAESVLESVSRFRFWQAGLPEPELQVLVGDAFRRYRVDFLWRAQRVIGEADGLLKYDAQGKAARAEKRRDVDLQEGWETVHWLWEEIWNNPELVIVRVRNAFARAQLRFG